VTRRPAEDVYAELKGATTRPGGGGAITKNA
jgi:hypothetical protein